MNFDILHEIFRIWIELKYSQMLNDKKKES